MEYLSESGRTGQRSPKPLAETKHSHAGGKDINILVLGKHGVGKTGKSVNTRIKCLNFIYVLIVFFFYFLCIYHISFYMYNLKV